MSIFNLYYRVHQWSH